MIRIKSLNKIKDFRYTRLQLPTKVLKESIDSTETIFDRAFELGERHLLFYDLFQQYITFQHSILLNATINMIDAFSFQ